MSKFQIVLLAIFGVFILAGVLVFSLARGGGSGSATVKIWGSIPAADFGTLLTAENLQGGAISYDYTEKSEQNFNRDMTEALAEGRGPDVVILTQERVWQNRNKLLLIPFESVSRKDFVDMFIEEAELFLADDGVYALPLYVDPLVLYSNRDLLTKAAIPRPLMYWDEIYTYEERLTELDQAGNIVKSTIALGEQRNIPHTKDLLSLLLLQAGNSITQVAFGELRPTLDQNPGLPTPPGTAALDFYTQFSNPSKPFYTWNRSLASAQTSFTSGDSAFYIGYGSELPILRAKSPTLNIGLSLVPQSRVSGKSVTFGRLYGAAVVRGSRNPVASLESVMSLVKKSTAQSLSTLLKLPPARRDILESKPTDGFLSVLYDAAIQSKGWLDPDADKSRLIMNTMVDSVTSGRARTDEAIRKATQELEALTN